MTTVTSLKRDGLFWAVYLITFVLYVSLSYFAYHAIVDGSSFKIVMPVVLIVGLTALEFAISVVFLKYLTDRKTGTGVLFAMLTMVLAVIFQVFILPGIREGIAIPRDEASFAIEQLLLREDFVIFFFAVMTINTVFLTFLYGMKLIKK